MSYMQSRECIRGNHRAGGKEDDGIMNKTELIEVWKRFAERNDFMLNPDTKRVNMLADGVLNNEKNHGLKYCPCRMTTGDSERDLLLVCPCNFKSQKTWKETGECWCSLFVRRK
jgi:ferredoxin-thioredoxin reductase catalytic chain